MKRVGHLISNLWAWLRGHVGVVLGAVVAAVAVGAGVYFLVTEVIKDEEQDEAPAPQAVVQQVPSDDPEPQDLGFPEFATKNTTRVAGADAVADAAGVALAVFPSTGGLEGPPAVALVDEADWASSIASASLMAEPVGAPTLFTRDGDVPELTTGALKALAPQGSADTDDRQVFRIGAAAEPEGLRSLDVAGDNPAEIAAGVDRLRQRLTGDEPAHLLLVSSDEPAFAMPAAAWAARSGDPVLFVQRDFVPKPTLEALKRHEDTPAYVLGPESAVSKKAFDQVGKAAPGAKRIAAPDPVESAIEFARYADGTFGWNINDPGHGFVLANAETASDAGAGAPLSGSGTWGPLLLTDDSEELPSALKGYLLDLKPGYLDDPTRAFYNHVWVIGDEAAVSVALQAQVDELAELAKVKSGAGGSVLGPPPGTPDAEAPSDQPGAGAKNP
jgi:ell wall binding domain 2 (CWB2)